MAKQGICPHCGQQLIGIQKSINYKGKSYCLACYNKIIEQGQADEQVLNGLYGYIKDLFGLSECPCEVINAVDYLVKQGKTLSGIRATIYYYYEIRENEANEESLVFLTKTVKEQYDNAKQYFIEQKVLKQKNMKVDINVPPRVVVMKEIPQSKKKKVKYRMEDL